MITLRSFEFILVISVIASQQHAFFIKALLLFF